MYSSRELRSALPSLLLTSADPSPAPDAALAAVLVPILISTPDPRVVFTKRTDTLSRHAGEISFPGGLADDGEDAASAALREAEEELGLASEDVQLVGSLPPVHTRVTGILIVPFVGLLERDSQFTPNPEEIAEILEFPLSHLIAHGAETEFQHEGRSFRTHVYEVGGNVIWGATARILWSFVQLLGSGRGTDRTGAVPA